MKECPKCHHCYDDSVISCEFDNKPLMSTIHGSVVISGRYILEQRLGNGGMGIVFKAKHKFLKSLYAIKIILPSLVEQDSNLLIRFKQEAVLAASIDHLNVVRVTDFGVEDEMMPYLVMEFVDGTPLSDFLKPNKPLSLKETLDFFQPIALGVAEAHRQGIVHRDLKPQNIMVQKNIPLKKGVKVLDFGLAKIKSSESFGSFVQTQANNILGSPPYMSPEQWENDQVDHRADIYGLGVILYQMLTGNLPFQADSIPAVMYQHLTVQPPAFATFGVSLAPEIENIARWALQKDREMRPAAVEDMLKEFEMAVVRSGVADVAFSTITPYSSSPLTHETTSQNDKTLAQNDKTIGVTLQLTNSQREKLSSYFDSSTNVSFSADEKLAHEFLDAKDRAEAAKVQATQADKLVQELAEAQKDAQEAQQKALDAKQRIEEDVRRRLETEMENKFAFEQQARQKAEAELLAQEIEARKKAEERANYLAQAALEAQTRAEIERKKSEEEAHQREIHESVRRETESHAYQLAQQVAESKKDFEEAKQLAHYEARLRRIAEDKQSKIEGEIQVIAENEAARRKIIEAEAQRQIQDQASRFEKEASEAQRRVEEARLLADFETQKREQAEVFQKRAEEEAQRLAEEIIRVQKQMQEIEKTIEPHSQSGRLSASDLTSSGFTSNSEQLTAPVINLQNKTTPNLPINIPTSTVSIQSSPSNPTYSGLMNTNPSATRRSPMLMIIAGVFAILLITVLGGFGIYTYLRPSPTDTKPLVTDNSSNVNSAPKPANQKKSELVLIQGGSFQMGRNDVTDKNEGVWGNQYPAHTVSVDSFNIGKTEVSNEEYAGFVQAVGYTAPANWTNGKMPEGQDKFPVTNVSLVDAKAYADWFSKSTQKQCSLPTEEQWEFAARNGSQQTSFPWGIEWRENASNLTSGKVSEVGVSTDETSVGVKDMLGNVFEWTSSKYALYPQHGGELPKNLELYVARGSYNAELQENLVKKSWFTTRRTPVPADRKAFSLGFRIACQP